MTDKELLRREYRKRLGALSSIQRSALSAAIRSVLSGWPPFKSSRSLVAFHPMKGEPNFMPLLLKIISAGHSLGLVRTPEVGEGDLLEVRLWDGSEASLERHRRMPLLQPLARLPRLDQDSWKQDRDGRSPGDLELQAASAGMVMVPGLAFGRDGTRLGHGMGWYDRFLKANPALLRVGIGFGLQLCDGLVADTWDQNLDFFICEEGVLQCQSSNKKTPV